MDRRSLGRSDDDRRGRTAVRIADCPDRVVAGQGRPEKLWRTRNTQQRTAFGAAQVGLAHRLRIGIGRRD